ncbi:hypothetical protein L9F63_028405, partial [Diploptera punctata]
EITKKYMVPESVPVPNTAELWRVTVHNAVPFVGFGFLDNFIMIIASRDHYLLILLARYKYLLIIFKYLKSAVYKIFISVTATSAYNIMENDKRKPQDIKLTEKESMNCLLKEISKRKTI